MVKFIRSIAFVLILCLLFILAQNILQPAFSDDVSRERALRGFESIEPNSVDVLFVGGSQMLYGIQPMELYRDCGIKAYNLASFSQTIDCSYYMAKYAFLTQSPQFVFVDASSIFSGNRDEERINAVWQVLLDALPVGSLKFEMARAYDALSCGDGFLAGMVPFFKYHSRWSELKPKDFVSIKTEPYCLAGAWTNTGTAPAGITIEEENELADGMRQLNDGRLKYMSGDELYTETIQQPFYSLEVSKEYEDYLLKLKELCVEHGAQLVLIKIPNLFYPQGGNGWPMDKSLKAREIAEEHQIQFYDLVYDYPNIVNYSIDSCDGGIHLNFRGASKLTAWVGNLLSNSYHIQGGSNSVYDAMLFNYQKFSDVASLESELDFSSYLKRLSEHTNEWTVFISSMDEYTQGMSAEDYQFIENSLGLQLADEGQYANPYAAIIDRGKVLYEASSNRKIEYETDVDGLSISLCSSGWFIDSSTSIQINGEEYAQGGRGLNIVVYDHASDQVIDSLSVDTYLPTKPITRNQKSIISYLSSYIHSSCYDYG